MGVVGARRFKFGSFVALSSEPIVVLADGIAHRFSDSGVYIWHSDRQDYLSGNVLGLSHEQPAR